MAIRYIFKNIGYDMAIRLLFKNIGCYNKYIIIIEFSNQTMMWIFYFPVAIL